MLAGAFVLLTVSEAIGMPLFASPPHFVAGREQRQIIFFLNESVQGALAVRVADDTVDVIVPASEVDPTVQGDRFDDADARIRSVVLTAAAHGATTIRIESDDSLGEVNARSADDPPRLIVVLGAEEAQRVASPISSPSAPKGRPPAKTPAQAPSKQAVPTAIPTASAIAPTERVTTTATVVVRVTATPFPDPSPSPAVPARVGSGGIRVADALGVEDDAAPAPAVGPTIDRDDGLPCAWRRWYGVPFCAPDPRNPAYARDPDTAAQAAALATPPQMPQSLPGDGPARDYLRADNIYVRHARTGRMLGAIQAYRRVLRRHPSFADAPRARLNIALAYRAMGFEEELRAAAETTKDAAQGTLLRALAGNVALEAGALERARADYTAVATQGDLGACLALRGALALALEGAATDRTATPSMSELEARCPRSIFEDPETQLLRARERLDAGDAGAAHALLIGLEERVPARSRARVIATRGAVAESSGDRPAARAAYRELAQGAYGDRAAQSAKARLALLDAADGDIEGGLERLRDLDPSAGADARRVLVASALADLDGSESASRAIALVHEAGIGAGALPLATQVHLARAYRELGFHARAAGVLQLARAKAGTTVPQEVWIESAHLARARGGWRAVLKTTETWLAAEGQSLHAAAMRARALAGVGEVDAAIAALAGAATRLASSEVRDLRIDVGMLLRTHDPKAAQRLLDEAATADVTPVLSDARAAELLWALGDVAEENGDEATALAAFARLARRYNDEPAASLAAYRHGRLTAKANAGAAYEDAIDVADGLERRAAEAAREFEAVVSTLAPKEMP